MKRYINFVIMVLAIPLCANTCTSCKKEMPTYHLDPIFKQYVLFPVGSYWIYEEENSKLQDSVYVATQEIYINDDIYQYKAEFAKQTLNSSNDKYGFIGDAFATDTSNTISFYREQLRTSLTGRDKVLFKGKVSEVYQIDEVTAVKYEALYDTLSVYKTIYNQVRVYTILTQSFDRQPQKVYYGQNVGMVKKELFNGEVWELKRYFINK